MKLPFYLSLVTRHSSLVNRKSSLLFFLCLLIAQGANCQTRYDSLRGNLGPLQTSYDVYFYDLTLKVDIDKKSIKGFNKIFYSATEDFRKVQVDLFSNLEIDSIVYKNRLLPFHRDSNAVVIEFLSLQKKGTKDSIVIYYKGQPIVAKNAPWDGGFVWSKDSLGDPWVGVACEGLGASSWWPCKDHLSDEPDSMRMSFIVPSRLQCISNGNLIKKEIFPDETAYTWKVSYPINAYNVTLNIANYRHFSDVYIRTDGSSLALDYYVLLYHFNKALNHFKQVKKVLKSYEHFFGDYPFPKDGYALVETPYLGMEHQSAIAYGDTFENKLGNFDFIIVHESAHEWWGNSVTAEDIGELWIHESFATYSESLLLEYYYGYQSALDYLAMQKEYIKNKNPLLKPRDVHFFDAEDTDIYYKGAWMLHTLRNVISDDSLWFKILKGIPLEFKRSVVSTKDITDYFNSHCPEDLSPVFAQYLNFPDIPTLVYTIKYKGTKAYFTYKWEADVENFNMPVLIELDNKKRIKLAPSCSSQTTFSRKEAESLRIMTELFYIKTENRKSLKKRNYE